jgi:hypothetical protein
MRNRKIYAGKGYDSRANAFREGTPHGRERGRRPFAIRASHAHSSHDSERQRATMPHTL